MRLFRDASTRSWQTPPGCNWFTAQEQMPAELVDLMEAYAYEYGETYDAYLATEDDRQYFWMPGCRGVVAFVPWRGVLNVLGGLLAPEKHQAQLLKHFLEFTELNGLTVNFFNIGRLQERMFRDAGCQVNKCTEELIVRLDRVTWQGKAYGWLRRQENYCVRQRLRFEEIDPHADLDYYRGTIVPQLEAVNGEHLDGTVHGRELVFFEGRFDPWALRRRRLFVVWAQQEIVAFILCNPALGGDMWAIEMYRRRADAPRGVIPFAMLQVMRQLKDEGVLYASLSCVPFLRCGPPIKNDDLRFQGACQIFWGWMNWLFDARGIYHYKSRFRPDYREMFLATYPRMTITSMMAMGFSWELFRIDPVRLARHAVGYWRGRRSRRSLADPPPRPERKLRELRRSGDPAKRPAAPAPERTPTPVSSSLTHLPYADQPSS